MPNHTSNQGTKNWNNIEMLFPLVRLKEKWSLPTSSIDEGKKKNGNLIPRWWERVTCQNLIKRKTCVSRGPTILFQHLHPREIPQPVHKWIWLETTWISIRRKIEHGRISRRVAGQQLRGMAKETWDAEWYT